MLLVISLPCPVCPSLPCPVSLGSPHRDNPSHVLSLCSCSVPRLVLIHGTVDCLGVCSRGVTFKTLIRLFFWELWYPPPLPLCPTHISTSSSLWKAARPSWAPLPVALGWQSVALCLLVGIWDLGRQMALELELKPFQQCHSDFRLLLPCG